MSVRIAVVGHVDNGKSTLIGRLLSDTDQVPNDKKAKVDSFCALQGRKYEYAFLLDAFEEEQSQGITIDVTEVQWAFEDRVYTLVDTPGHREFLKKMVGGASRVDAAMLIVDAVEGVPENLIRQIQLLDVIGIEQKIILINKMDMVDWNEAVFKNIKHELKKWVGKDSGILLIPISAWHGVNLFEASEKTSWYSGPSLAQALRSIRKKQELGAPKTRFQIQDVYRIDEKRIYVGRVESGCIRVGDGMCFAPGLGEAKITSIEVFGEERLIAESGDAVGLTINTSLFLDRGHIGYFKNEAPEFSRTVVGEVFWLNEEPLKLGERVTIKVGTREESAVVESIPYNMREKTWQKETSAQQIQLMGQVQFRFDKTFAFDTFSENEKTSRFVVCRNRQVMGGGRWVERGRDVLRESNDGTVMWFIGLSGAGKSTLTQALKLQLERAGQRVFVIDGDVMRGGLCRDLGFSMNERMENIRRAAEVAKMAADQGFVVLAAFITPMETHRQMAREIIGAHRFKEIFVDCPLSVCEERDVKGLYAKARRGEIPQLTGVGSDFETPLNPDVHIKTNDVATAEAVQLLEKFLNTKIINSNWRHREN